MTQSTKTVYSCVKVEVTFYDTPEFREMLKHEITSEGLAHLLLTGQAAVVEGNYIDKTYSSSWGNPFYCESD